MDNKEYKVLSSNTPAFSNPEKLKEILAEESEAGWDLEEVIDSNKIRLARDKSARENDANRKINPYRIKIGVNDVVYLGSAAVVTLIIIYLIIQAAALSV